MGHVSLMRLEHEHRLTYTHEFSDSGSMEGRNECELRRSEKRLLGAGDVARGRTVKAASSSIKDKGAFLESIVGVSCCLASHVQWTGKRQWMGGNVIMTIIRHPFLLYFISCLSCHLQNGRQGQLSTSSPTGPTR